MDREPLPITERDELFLKSYGLTPRKHVHFFSRRPELLTIFMLLSLGTYALYWFYRNWDAVRQASDQKMWPLVRALFAFFWAWPLFKIMVLQARAHGSTAAYSGGGLAALYIVPAVLVAIGSSAKDQFNLMVIGNIVVALIGALVLMYVQNLARLTIAAVHPTEDEDDALPYSPPGQWEGTFVLVFCVLPLLSSLLDR